MPKYTVTLVTEHLDQPKEWSFDHYGEAAQWLIGLVKSGKMATLTPHPLHPDYAQSFLPITDPPIDEEEGSMCAFIGAMAGEALKWQYVDTAMIHFARAADDEGQVVGLLKLRLTNGELVSAIVSEYMLHTMSLARPGIALRSIRVSYERLVARTILAKNTIR